MRGQLSEEASGTTVDTLEIKVAIQISKPPHEVYEAIVDPEKMSKYFISTGSGRMEEGKEVRWRFPEFDAEFPIRVGYLERDKYILPLGR